MSFLLLLFLFLLLIAIISKKRDYFELKIIHRKGDDGNLRMYARNQVFPWKM